MVVVCIPPMSWPLLLRMHVRGWPVVTAWSAARYLELVWLGRDPSSFPFSSSSAERCMVTKLRLQYQLVTMDR